MRRYLVPVLVAISFAVPMALFESGRPAPTGAAPPGNVIPDQYIVTLKPDQQPNLVGNRLTAQAEIRVKHVYRHALNGFSATIPAKRLEKVRDDPAVLSVVEDRVVTISSDTRPSGVRRSEADRNALSQIGSHTNPINVDVAVIDTGIDNNHPDLNVVGGVNCVSSQSSWDDQHGHGTHVAGTIGALDNESGVVGVAPGARLWAVRVLDAQGEGEFSDVICGVDWVTANAGMIEIVNMSLGGEGTAEGCTGGGLHQAICQSVDAGITYVVASGNSGIDAGAFVPASYPEVITVSALADTDGKPGGEGPSSIFYGNDDTLATFSNYGSAVDIAAPGVNIQSTWLGGSYNTISGTSMASPHVAGAAAIYAFQNPGASPAAVRSHILSQAWAQSSTEGFSGDPDGFAEPLLNAGTIGGLDPLPPPPPPVAGCNLTSESGVVGSSTTISCAGFEASEWVWLYWDSAATGPRGLFIASGAGDGSATITIPDAAAGEHSIIAIGNASGTQSSLPFTVLSSVEITSTSGTVGTFLVVYAKGFAANEPVELRWHSDAETYVVLKTATTSATGRANIYGYVPDGEGGSYTVEAVGLNSGASGASVYTILPGLKLSPTSGKVGANLTITLTGFQAGESAGIRWSGVTVANVTADALGKTVAPVTAPEAPSGATQVEAIGAGGSHASATYTIVPSMVVSDTSVAVGDQIDVSLTGFAANESVRLDWYDTTASYTTLQTLQTSASGSTATTFQVPEALSGSHRLVATGLSSGKSSTAYFAVASSIKLSKTGGTRGELITATMTGYAANTTIDVKWYETLYSGSVIGSTTSSALGSALLTFQVPANASFGDHKVESASSTGQGRTSTVFTVEGVNGPVEATCTVAPESGVPGSQATVECYGFQPGEYIRVHWDTTTSTQKTMFHAGNGSGSGKFMIPDAAAGEHTLIGVGSSSAAQATTTFNVLPSLHLNSGSGAVGAYIFATARGYAAGETINFVWSDGTSSDVLKSVTASATGRAIGSLSVPEVAGGTYSILAVGQASGNSAAAQYSVTPGLKLSTTIGKVGSNLSVTVTGFDVGAEVDISWEGAALGTIITSQSGSGTFALVVPEAPEGTHSLSAQSDTGDTAAASFRVLPNMLLSSINGIVGAEVTVEMTGFGAGESIRIEWYDTSTSYSVIDTLTASPLGSATLSFAVPESTYGTHRVQAAGLHSQKTTNGYFTVLGAVSLSVEQGVTGTTVTATLTGFKANETTSLHWYTNGYTSFQIGSGTTDAAGTTSITFDVPDGATAGSYKVEGRSAIGFPRAHALFTVS